MIFTYPIPGCGITLVHLPACASHPIPPASMCHRRP